MNPTITASMIKRSQQFLLLTAILLVLPGCRKSEGVKAKTYSTTAALDVNNRAAIIEVAQDDAADLPRTASIVSSIFSQVSTPLDFSNPNSEINRLNELGENTQIPISRDLRWILVQAKRIHEHSEGVFDGTAAPLRFIYGFHRDVPDMEVTEGMIEATLGVVNQKMIRVDPGGARLMMPGIRIDLTGIINGYLLDRMILDLRQTDIQRIRVQLETCVRVLGQPDANPWLFEIPDPWNPETVLGTVELHPRRCIAYTERDAHTRLVNGEPVSSVISPVTGYPAKDNALALVTGPTATMCEAFSRAVLLTGTHSMTNLLEHYVAAESVVFQEFPEKKILMTQDFPVTWKSDLPYTLEVMKDPDNIAVPEEMLVVPEGQE